MKMTNTFTQPTWKYPDPPVGEQCDDRHRMTKAQWSDNWRGSASHVGVICCCGKARYGHYVSKDEHTPATVAGGWFLIL